MWLNTSRFYCFLSLQVEESKSSLAHLTMHSINPVFFPHHVDPHQVTTDIDMEP